MRQTSVSRNRKARAAIQYMVNTEEITGTAAQININPSSWRHKKKAL
jgi:hypothetical protein